MGKRVGGDAAAAHKTRPPDRVSKLPAQLAAETRTYMVDEHALSAWLTGEEKFFVTAFVVDQASKRLEITLSTQRAEKARVVVDAREPGRLTEAERGPSVVDDVPENAGVPVNGTSDAERILPLGARSGDKLRLRTRRELDAERVKNGLPPVGTPRITHRESDEDDPVPSAIPHADREA